MAGPSPDLGAERTLLWYRVADALHRRAQESLRDAARRALRSLTGRTGRRGRVARAVLFGPTDPWERLVRADRIAAETLP